ncbi:MAG: hypothetical protein KDB27_16180 [Planctomycetales bacterium]|nr:hypothetical protein [Planctomycetales bacterium]
MTDVMGMWGMTLTENDAACNWIESLFDVTHLESRLQHTLNGDVHEEAAEIRAAANMVRTLIAADMWPSDTRQEMAELASSQLQRMLDEKVYTNSLLVAEIRREIRQFDERPCERSR